MSRVLTVTSQESAPALPAIITREGRKAITRFLEFFTVNIRNPIALCTCVETVTYATH
jgi:hypothetical protein